MRQLTTWLVSALFFAASGALCTWLFLHDGGESEQEHPSTTEAPGEVEKPAVTRDSSGAVVVRMDAETQQRVGLLVAPVESVTDQPQVMAYGSVLENPSATFTLRAAVAGTIVAGSVGDWPGMGRQLPKGANVGGLVPRVGPVERVDLASKLATAHADVEDARASLVALRASLESKRQLNAGGQRIVSDQALQEAEAKVKSEEARLRAAEATVRTLERSMTGTSKPDDTIPLVVRKAGRVVEVTAHPGESVESGQSLLRVSDFGILLARVALPVGKVVGKITSATVVVAGYEDHPLAVRESSLAPTVDPLTGGQTFLLEFSTEGFDLQPGMSAAAQLSVAGAPLKGVAVPAAAIIRYVGAGWVYVQSAEDTFVRREVPLTRPVPQGWFVAEGLEAGTPIVVRGAQPLLSEELKFQVGGGGEEEE